MEGKISSPLNKPKCLSYIGYHVLNTYISCGIYMLGPVVGMNRMKDNIYINIIHKNIAPSECPSADKIHTHTSTSPADANLFTGYRSGLHILITTKGINMKYDYNHNHYMCIPNHVNQKWGKNLRIPFIKPRKSWSCSCSCSYSCSW